MLDDSSFWRPDQSNEVFRLDLPALVRGGAGAPVKLSDQAVHPLVRAGAILDDLEGWHRAAGKREAALESRLRRFRLLEGHFTERDDRARIRQSLEALLPSFRTLPWSSMAAHQLAQSYRTAGDLPKALKVATDGAALHPGSPGARFCQALIGDLNEPELQLSAMGLDAPRKRSLMLVHKNIKTAHFRAYPVDLASAIASAGVRRTFSLEQPEQLRLLRDQQPSAEWAMELPATPDLRTHRAFNTPPMERRGLYAVAVSDRRDFAAQRSRTALTLLLLSDLVIQTSQEPNGTHEIRVLSGSTGRPVAGAAVEVSAEDWNGNVRPRVATAHHRRGRVRPAWISAARVATSRSSPWRASRATSR